MTKETWASVLIPTIPAVLAWMQGLHNKAKIQEIHLTMNSRLDELVKAATAAARAAGKAEGIAEQKLVKEV